MTILNHLLKVAADYGAGFLTLLDPGDQPKNKLIDSAMRAEEGGADAILIGGSQIVAKRIDGVVREIKTENQTSPDHFPVVPINFAAARMPSCSHHFSPAEIRNI